MLLIPLWMGLMWCTCFGIPSLSLKHSPISTHNPTMILHKETKNDPIYIQLGRGFSLRKVPWKFGLPMFTSDPPALVFSSQDRYSVFVFVSLFQMAHKKLELRTVSRGYFFFKGVVCQIRLSQLMNDRH